MKKFRRFYTEGFFFRVLENYIKDNGNKFNIILCLLYLIILSIMLLLLKVFVEGILNEVSLFNLPFFHNDEFINQTWEIHQKVHEIYEQNKCE